MRYKSHQINPQQQALQQLSPKNTLVNVGNKARQLGNLKKLGMLIPGAWVLGYEVFNQYKAGSPIKTSVMAELESKLDPEKKYAVRSSSNIEDSLKYSFAGLFKTILDVKGFENIYTADRKSVV